MHVPALIERKRDGTALTPQEISELIAGFTSGAVPDYQMSAFAMAVYFRGMSDAETAALTAAMRDSGRRFDWPAGTPPKIDKHSTGGIGDKVSLVLAPLLACEDFWVPMVSGRGLGITGGTLDKLESIAGFQTGLEMDHCLRQLEKIRVVMIGQSADFCPADKKLYALRDVTGTVASRPLIIASIMSKKLAESLDRLVLDVKFGSGAFMKTREEAVQLAEGLCGAGRQNGVETTFLLSPMEEPLGHTAGNALEVAEAIACLSGKGPADLLDLTMALAESVSHISRSRLEAHIASGAALERFGRMIEAQHGDARVVEDPSRLPSAPVVKALTAPSGGTVCRVDAGAIGRVCVALGAGRRSTGDSVDPAVGVARLVKTGTVVSRGDLLLEIHARTETAAEQVVAALSEAVEVG